MTDARETEPLIGGLGGGPAGGPVASPAPSSTLAPLRDPRTAVIFAALWFGVFVAAADSTIVTTLLAAISNDLKVLDSISWVATAYLVAFSAFQPLYGKLSDIYGRKSILAFGTLVFGVGCQLCAVARTFPLLIAGRVLNGVGAGAMLSMGSITMTDYISPRLRGVYQGIGNLVFGAGAALGGIIGGLAQEYSGWRLAFGLQVPLSAASLLVLMVLMPNTRPKDEVLAEDSQLAGHVVRRSSFERVDLVGCASLSTSMCLLMLGVTTGGNQFAWASAPIALFFLGSLALLALFVYWERHKAIEPVLPLFLFNNSTSLCTYLVNFFKSGITYTFMYYGPIFWAACLDYSPTQISHRLLFQFVGGSSASLGAGIIMQRTGRYYTLWVSCAVVYVVAAAGWLCQSLFPHSVASTVWWQGLVFMLTGGSYAAILTVSIVCLVNAVPDHQAAATSGQYTFRGSGSSIILASSAAIFNQVLGSQLRKNVVGKHAARTISRVLKSVEAIREAPLELQPAIIQSYRNTCTVLFATMLGLSVLSLVSAVQIKEFSLKGHQEDAR